MASLSLSTARRIYAHRPLAWVLCCAVVAAGAPSGCTTAPDPAEGYYPVAVVTPGDSTAVEPSQQLDQLVAPIALYPDPVVAQILAAATFPAELVEAERWMQAHPNLTGTALAQPVDQQPWDDSVKALTQFPAVLANMNQNLSWTSELGDAYTNQPEAVLAAIQIMRRRAQQAGNLSGGSQEIITTEGPTISIEPADPNVVYLPEYDPWLVYGDPVAAYADWAPYPGLYLDSPGFAWGAGFGLFGGFGWGWRHWGADWHAHRLEYDHHAYASGGRTFVGRATGFHAGGDFAAGGEFHGGVQHSFARASDPISVHSGAFSGFDHGGIARAYAYRGRSSLGGFHGGFAGGGFHGGGFHGGGGHR